MEEEGGEMDEVILGLLSFGSEAETDSQLHRNPAPPIFRWNGTTFGNNECLLCKDPGNPAEAVSMTYHETTNHSKDAVHLANVKRAKVLQKSACQKLRTAQSLSQQMNSTGAPDSFRVDLVRYLFNPTLAGPPDTALVDKMKSQLDKFERNEPTTLLELAVWKAACLINYQHPIKDLFELRDWWNNGWKANKSECRRHPLIDAVLTNVSPFLDRPDSETGLEPPQKRSKTISV